MKRLAILAALLLACGQATAAGCWVSEFNNVASLSGGQSVQIAKGSGAGPTTQAVTATEPVAVTNAFASGARWLWIYCDEVVFYQFGTTPVTGMVAAHGSGLLMPIPAGGFWLGLPDTVSNGTLKIALCDANCAT